MYNKTHWQDRVVDPETGEVIQEGTFMSAERFNNIENGIAANNELITEAQSDIESMEVVLKTSVGVDISMSMDPETYVLNLTLKNQNGQTLREQSIDLPIESMFIGAFFNEETKTLVLTTQSDETIEVPLTAIISGLVNDSRKIAGLDLKDDITTAELRQALNINNVGNFKAVSTATSQGLSSTEQANARANVGLGNVENKSSATILEELTNNNIANALGFTPMSPALKGSPNGLAELDPSGKVPSSQLPSYVDDVIEATAIANFPATGEAGKIYVDTSTNKTYRWSGSAYVEISASLALGETSSTAYRGDRGKAAYDHSQATHARIDATKTAASSTNGNILINGTEITVYKHPAGTNPHGTTKSDVGLGNVPNVATNDQTPSYTEASSLAKLTSGEKLSVAFGKISKAVTDLISHLADSVKHITSTERTNWNAAKTHADSAHAPSSAQANVIETVKVNGTALTPSSKAVNITVPVTTDTYSSTGTAPVNGKAVASAIGALDVAAVSVGTTETIKSISETDGKIAVTKQSIAIKSNQVNGMTSYSKATSSSAIATSDSLNTAVGKLEYKADTNVTNISNANTQIADIYNRCGGGKNLIDFKNLKYARSGFTTYSKTDDSITVTSNGTYAHVSYYLPNLEIGKQYKLSFKITNFAYTSGSVKIRLSAASGGTGDVNKDVNITADGKYSVSFTVTDSNVYEFILFYPNFSQNSNVNSFTCSELMLKFSGDDTYVPYVPTNAELYSMFENRKVFQAANWLKTFTIKKVNLSNVITKIYIKHNTFLKEFIIINNTVFGDASNTNLSYTLSDGNVTFTCVDTMLAFVEQYIC